MPLGRNLIVHLSSVALVLVSVSSLLPIAPEMMGNPFPSPLGRHPFTVKDSIEMARFERTGGGPLFSPDKKYFVVVTSRGILESDKIESTIWLFDSEQVSKVLGAQGISEVPPPRVLARFAAIPQADYSDSYEPIISVVRWSRDSRDLLFLAQNCHGERQLYRTNIDSKTLQAISLPGSDVNLYAAVDNTIVYTATSSQDNVSLGIPINSNAVDVTGLTWSAFLFVDDLAANSLRCNELWVVRNRKNVRVEQRLDRQSCLLNRFDQVLSLSPDAHSVVVLRPVRGIPEDWRKYRPSFPDRTIDPSSADQSALTNPLRMTEYEIIRLSDGKREPLLDAPSAWALGFPDLNDAVWSKDGKKLLLLNTYLPLDVSGPEEKAKRVNPCVAALVDLASHANTCLAFSDYPNSSSFLIAASFAKDNQNVVLDFRNAQNGKTREGFRLVNGTWKIVAPDSQSLSEARSGPRPNTNHQDSLSVDIKQDLNTPPALWASDPKTGQNRKIWDPNPRLSTLELGTAATFHWKDATGHEWSGGLVKPPDYVRGRRYPLVIQTHGFLENEFITDGQYTTAFAARPLAAAGIVVLQMGENYSYKSLADEAPLQILGYESAIQQLASEGLIDPSRVGIIGFSRTCYHVEAAMIKNPSLFAAATIADGVDQSYMQEMLFGVGSTSQNGVEIYGAKPFGEGLRKWFDGAPGFHLDRLQTPLRIEALRAESVLGEWEIYSSLMMQRKPVEMVYFPAGQHILQKPLERMASQQGNVDWFRFWLKNEEDLTRSDARKYTRWRTMRDKLVRVDNR